MPYKDPAKARARDRQCYRRLTEERIALGLCPKCGQASPTPNHSLCQRCGEKRRKAERARYAAGKTAGKLYGGCDAERCRRIARDRSRRRDQARKAAGLCTRCGRHPPVEGGTVCEPCREARRESEREQYAEWRAAGECGRCGAPVPDGGSRCERCARCEAKRSRKNAKNAQNRQRYARRRARRLCTDCGELSRGASRCPACARVSVSPAGRRPYVWPASRRLLSTPPGEPQRRDPDRQAGHRCTDRDRRRAEQSREDRRRHRDGPQTDPRCPGDDRPHDATTISDGPAISIIGSQNRRRLRNPRPSMPHRTA